MRTPQVRGQLSFADIDRGDDWWAGVKTWFGIDKPGQETQACISDYLARVTPDAPLVADEWGYDLARIRSPRCWWYPYIEPNTTVKHFQVVLDIDASDGVDRVLSGRYAPVPTWTVETKTAGHCHAGWVLDAPVCKTDAAKPKPLHYLARLEETLRRRLEADRGYAGVIASNPVYFEAQTFWGPNRAFQLHTLRTELAATGPIAQHYWRADHATIIGLGRNCTLFELGRHLAYAHWRHLGYDNPQALAEYLNDQLEQLNTREFDTPLQPQEISHITKSLTKWTTTHHTPETFATIQHHRGKKGGSRTSELKAQTSAKNGAKNQSAFNLEAIMKGC